MIDDEMRKEKYRCEFNGTNGITVGDLFFKAANPIYNRPVKVKKGEYILTELLDFADLKKSRTSGALKKFIEMGWIVVEDPSAILKKENKVSPLETITELNAGLIKAEDITNFTATSKQPRAALDYPKELHPKVVETLPFEKSRTVNSFAISETEAIKMDVTKEFEQFNSLRYFQKLKTIKETTNVKLLEMISVNSNYPQLVHNSKNRLRELQTK